MPARTRRRATARAVGRVEGGGCSCMGTSGHDQQPSTCNSTRCGLRYRLRSGEVPAPADSGCDLLAQRRARAVGWAAGWRVTGAHRVGGRARSAFDAAAGPGGLSRDGTRRVPSGPLAARARRSRPAAVGRGWHLAATWSTRAGWRPSTRRCVYRRPIVNRPTTRRALVCPAPTSAGGCRGRGCARPPCGPSRAVGRRRRLRPCRTS